MRETAGSDGVNNSRIKKDYAPTLKNAQISCIKPKCKKNLRRKRKMKPTDRLQIIIMGK